MTAGDTRSPTAHSKPEVKADPNEALKSLAMPELLTKLGSSTDGLTQAEAQKRLTQYGPNEIEEKKTNEILKFLGYFWGPDTVDDRSGCDPVGGRPALAGLRHHPASAGGQCGRWFLGRAPGG